MAFVSQTPTQRRPLCTLARASTSKWADHWLVWISVTMEGCKKPRKEKKTQEEGQLSHTHPHPYPNPPFSSPLWDDGKDYTRNETRRSETIDPWSTPVWKHAHARAHTHTSRQKRAYSVWNKETVRLRTSCRFIFLSLSTEISIYRWHSTKTNNCNRAESSYLCLPFFATSLIRNLKNKCERRQAPPS